jgi:NADH dehydrogenase
MTIKKVLLLGGSGFVGTAVANHLANLDITVTVPSRRRERHKALIALPNVDMVEANINDPVQLQKLMVGQDAVINLVGILHSSDLKLPYSRKFAEAHVELPKKIVAAAKATGIKRLLHMSALKASPDAPSEYLRSKADGEAVVKASGLDVTIFRPSVIFGVGDSFLTTFAKLLRVLPRFYVGYGHAKFQPVHVADVAEVIVRSLLDSNAVGQTYELVGPKVYSLRQIIEYVNELTGTHRKIGDLPEFWALVQAGVLSLMPKPLLSPDNLRSMEVDSVAADAQMPFGIVPTAMEAVAPTYLLGVAVKQKYDLFRLAAGR